jgi:hypothetical protein
MIPTNGPASNTRSRSAPVQQIPPFRPIVEEEDISVASTTILHRDTTLIDLLRNEQKQVQHQQQHIPMNINQQYSLNALHNSKGYKIPNTYYCPAFGPF